MAEREGSRGGPDPGNEFSDELKTVFAPRVDSHPPSDRDEPKDASPLDRADGVVPELAGFGDLPDEATVAAKVPLARPRPQSPGSSPHAPAPSVAPRPLSGSSAIQRVSSSPSRDPHAPSVSPADPSAVPRAASVSRNPRVPRAGLVAAIPRGSSSVPLEEERRGRASFLDGLGRAVPSTPPSEPLRPSEPQPPAIARAPSAVASLLPAIARASVGASLPPAIARAPSALEPLPPRALASRRASTQASTSTGPNVEIHWSWADLRQRALVVALMGLTGWAVHLEATAPSQRQVLEQSWVPTAAPTPPRSWHDLPQASVVASGPATLSIFSAPAGARVRLDGADVGETPLIMTTSAGGGMHLRLDLRGHQPWEGDLLRGSRDQLDVRVDLLPGDDDPD